MSNQNTDILKTVIRTMVAGHMVEPGESILVAVSGGVDSVTLLWCLTRLAKRFAVAHLGVAHLDHGLRGNASDEDMAFVKRLTEGYGLPFYGERADVSGFTKKHGLSPEESARRLRYDFFMRTAEAQGYDKIATAHHSDDNAEQVLLGLLRGSGPAGLAGIPPVRDGKVIRPLIDLTRAEILAAAGRKKLEYMIDATNIDPRFLRNRVRHELIPVLQRSFNSNISHNLNQVADIFRQENNWLEPMVSDIFDGVVHSHTGEELVLSVPEMKKQPRAVQRRLIRKALAMVKGDLRRIGFVHVENIIDMIYKNRSIELYMPGKVIATRSYDRLVFRRASVRGIPAAEPAFSYTLVESEVNDGSVYISETGVKITFSVIEPRKINERRIYGKGDTAFFDLERLAFPLTVRNMRPGDRFIPLGMNGHQKVKDYFINNKVPRADRRSCPVIVSGGRIIWLAGFRVADPVKITPATTRVLKATLVGPAV